MFGGFRLVPYATVASVVNQLDDRIFNTLPEQPEPKSKPPSKSKPQKTTSESGAGAKPTPETSSTKPTPHTTLTDQPPENNPLEEPNIWATILKLEGRSMKTKLLRASRIGLEKV